MKLHPEVDILRLYKLFLVRVKRKVDNPDFTLVVKMIFNSEKANSSFQERSFVKCDEQYLKAVYIEVCSYQVLEVTSKIKKIIKSEAFQK